jgi:hypothetical protein
MHFRSVLLSAVAAATGLTMIGVPAAQATVLATIVGAYDNLVYDTPELQINNTSGGTIGNVTMTLIGYQGLNNGVVENITGLSFAPGISYLDWGSIPGANGATSPGNLTAYDYDDEWGNTPGGYTNPACVVGGGLCSIVGNFQVTMNGLISGGPSDGVHVATQFSPNVNYTGGFVGWQGLDQNGLSETVYDQHTGTFSGTMAVITEGTITPGVPEPSTWAMMALGFVGLGFLGYRSSSKAASIAA